MRELVEHHSTRLPFIGKVLLDWQLFLDLIVELDQALPHDYRDAQELLRTAEQRNEETERRAAAVQEKAEAEAKRIVDAANERAAALATEHEIARLAQERAAELARHADEYAATTRAEAEAYAGETARQADEYADSTRRSTDEYALRMLSHVRSVLTKANASVDDGLQQLKTGGAGGQGDQGYPRS